MPALSTSAATSVVMQAYSNGVSGNVSGISSTFPSAISSGDVLVVNVIYLSNTSNSISIVTPQDSYGNSFSSMTTPQQLSVSNDYFQSEWFAATSQSAGPDSVISATASSVAQICVSIFDLQNFYSFSASGSIGVGSGSTLSTSYYALPAGSVSLVGDLAAITGLSYTAGTGYAASKISGTGTPCNGEYDLSASTISTDAPAALGSSTQAFFWFEQGITLESSPATTSSTSTTPSTSTTTTTDSTSTATSTVTTTTSSSTSSTTSTSTSHSTSTSSTSTSKSTSTTTKTTTVTSTTTSTSSGGKSGQVLSGIEEPYVWQEVALASNPSKVFQVVGGIVAQKVVGSAYKNYFYLYLNPSITFNLNTTGETSVATTSGYSTSNVYWNVQTPATGNDGSGSQNYATVGQDLDLGATSNTLSEWQWSNMNYVFSGSVSKVSYTGSYDGGGPTACHVYSNNQERHSVYELFIQTGTTNEYTITGGELIQQTINGVESTTFVVLVSTTHSANFESGDVTDCAEVLNPISGPALRWYVRTPPVSGNITGATLTGNFGITGTMGAAMVPAATTNALIFEQFVNRTFQTGYIPNQGCATCISILGSQDPVSGNSANWPG